MTTAAPGPIVASAVGGKTYPDFGNLSEEEEREIAEATFRDAQLLWFRKAVLRAAEKSGSSRREREDEAAADPRNLFGETGEHSNENGARDRRKVPREANRGSNQGPQRPSSAFSASETLLPPERNDSAREDKGCRGTNQGP